MVELGALKVAKELCTGVLTVATDWLKAAFIGCNCTPSWHCKVYPTHLNVVTYEPDSQLTGLAKGSVAAWIRRGHCLSSLALQRALFVLIRRGIVQVQWPGNELNGL